MKRITSEERNTVDFLLKQKKKPAQIAALQGRSRSTITREIKRNCDLRNGTYRHELAHKKSCKRKAEKATRRDLLKPWQGLYSLIPPTPFLNSEVHPISVSYLLSMFSFT